MGHRVAPFEPPSEPSFDGRFDDPGRVFRTLYVAEQAETAIAEVFAPLRPKLDAVVRMERELDRRAQGGLAAVGEALEPEGPDDDLSFVRLDEHRHRRLVRADVDLAGALCDVTKTAERSRVAGRYADVLADHGVPHLDLTDITSRNRRFTKALAGRLHADGFAGVRYRSNVRDDGVCLALFEGRFTLTPTAGEKARSLLTDARTRRLVVTVLDELGLKVE